MNFVLEIIIGCNPSMTDLITLELNCVVRVGKDSGTVGVGKDLGGA